MVDDDIIAGRPYGGTAILWRTPLDTHVRRVIAKRRFCAIAIDLNGDTILVICVYCPSDLRCALPSGDLLEMLDDLECLCSSEHYDYIAMVGDWNCECDRNTSHCTAVCNFWERLNVVPLVSLPCSSVKCTYIGPQGCSLIDHILVTPNMLNYASCYSTIDAIDDFINTSDHLPVRADFDISLTHHDGRADLCRISRPAFYKASRRDLIAFQSALRIKLDALNLSSAVIGDDDINHHLDSYHDKIVLACCEAANEHIPSVGGSGQSRRLPGWNAECSSLRKDSLFWHNLWASCGRPRCGTVADVMRQTRRKYHHAVKSITKNQEQSRLIKLASAISQDDSRNFWFEAKRLRGRVKVQTVIEDANTPESIAHLFADDYASLYSSVADSESDIDAIFAECTARCSDDSWVDFTTNEVRSAIDKIAAEKWDASHVLCSSELHYGPDTLLVHLAHLFNQITRHGYVPVNMRVNTIIPLLKNSYLDPRKKANYRAISLSSILGKVLDHLILARYQQQLSSCDYQFAFKPGASCNLCTLVVKEVVKHFVDNGSTPTVCFLDMTKAFDKVNHSILFKKLRDRGLSPFVIRVLIGLYTRQTSSVSWDGVSSNSFIVHNGVKQGGVASPILFSLYIDSLLGDLKQLGLGCHIGKRFYGAVAYADDIALLAPSIRALTCMLNVCVQYAMSHDIVFNAAKSACVTFSTSGANPQLTTQVMLGNSAIPFVTKAKHLGHMLSYDLSDNADTNDKLGAFYSQVNGFMSIFKLLRCDLKAHYFDTYCSSWYGCELWSPTTCRLNALNVAWRKSIRRLWQLPNTCHCAILPSLMKGTSLSDVLYMRALKLASQTLSHKNVVVRELCRRTVHNVESHIGAWTANRQREFPRQSLHQITTALSRANDNPSGNILLELLLVREGVSTIENLSRNDIDDLITTICCD
jgi:hypothetical protein